MDKPNTQLILNDQNSIYFEDILSGQKFKFYSKFGLFSKDKIDHGSKLLIENMDIKPTDTVLDLGCGYGAIGLVATKKAYLGQVYLVDNDIRAINFATLNADLNNIKNAKIKISDGFQNLTGLPFDVILSNPPSHISNQLLEEFIQGSFKHLKRGGKLYLVNESRLLPVIKRILNQYFQNYQAASKLQNYTLSLVTKE